MYVYLLYFLFVMHTVEVPAEAVMDIMKVSFVQQLSQYDTSAALAEKKE